MVEVIEVVELVSDPSEESASISFATSSSTWRAGEIVGSEVVHMVT
jgi:hypothetical protein